MLDIRLIKENPDFVKERLASRQKDYAADIDRVLQCDAERRALISDTESKRAAQNAVSKKIPQMKKAGEDTTAIMAEMKALAETVKTNNEKIDALDAEIEKIMLFLPNLPDESVPYGKDDSENVEIRRWGEPRKFDFEPKAHWDIGADLGILDPETAAKIAGARFTVYRGMGARLERAVISF